MSEGLEGRLLLQQSLTACMSIRHVSFIGSTDEVRIDTCHLDSCTPSSVNVCPSCGGPPSLYIVRFTPYHRTVMLSLQQLSQVAHFVAVSLSQGGQDLSARAGADT